MENNKYIIRKYDERRYGIYDTENNEFIQIGLLTDIQEALKEYENKNLNSEKERNEEKVKENKTIKTEATGTDVAVSAILKYSNDGKTLDQDWLNNEIKLLVANTKPLTDAIVNSRRPAHSIAYDGLLLAINEKVDGHGDLSSRQIQAGFKKLGLDYKEVIKPSVEYVEEEREDLKEESKEIKTESLSRDESNDGNNLMDKLYQAEIKTEFGKKLKEKLYNILLDEMKAKNDKVEESLENPKQEIIDAVNIVKKDSLESGMYGEDEFILQCYDAYRDITNKLDISKEDKDTIKDYAKQVYKSLNESKEVKTEERVNRVLHKGDRFENPNGVVCTIIDVDNEHLLDGEPQVTYEIGRDTKCYKMSSVNGMLNQNKYELQESKEIKTEKFFNLYNSYDKEFGISKYRPEELIKFLDSLKDGNRISDKDYKLLTTFANDYKNLIDSCGYESKYIENKEIKTEGPEDWEDGLQPQLSDDDEYTFDKEDELSNLHDDETVLDELQNRIGVEMNVGELNNMLQTLFGTFNKSYILRSDLYNKDLDANQELVVDDDGDFYVINYDIIDIDTGTIEITDVNLD